MNGNRIIVSGFKQVALDVERGIKALVEEKANGPAVCVADSHADTVDAARKRVIPGAFHEDDPEAGSAMPFRNANLEQVPESAFGRAPGFLFNGKESRRIALLGFGDEVPVCVEARPSHDLFHEGAVDPGPQEPERLVVKIGVSLFVIAGDEPADVYSRDRCGTPFFTPAGKQDHFFLAVVSFAGIEPKEKVHARLIAGFDQNHYSISDDLAKKTAKRLDGNRIRRDKGYEVFYHGETKIRKVERVLPCEKEKGL
jgi:hypothetical protein